MKSPGPRITLPILSLIVVLFGLTTQSWAQQTPKRMPGYLGYLEYLPPGYSTSNPPYPCIIFLHGSGERGDGNVPDINKVAAHGVAKFIKNGATMCFTVNGVNECFVVLSPQQTTNRFGWVGDVHRFLDYALATYNIDPDRLYITGLSMGGDGSWDTSYDAANVPNYIAAMVPVSGAGDFNKAKKTAQAKIAVWAIHGDKDTQVPLADGKRPINGMNTQSPNPAPIWTVVVNGTHGSSTWDKAYSPTHTYYNPNIYEWFLSYRRGVATPKPPTVDAGVNKTITLPTANTSLTGTATDPDGTIASTAWTQTGGPVTGVIATPAGLTTNITGLTTAGTYTFTLTATDNSGLTASDFATVQVIAAPPPMPPVANAGPDKSITAPVATVTFNGSGADSDGTIASYSWSQTSGPNTATLSGNTTATLVASGLIVGSYTFTLTVTDNAGLTGIDQVSVTVLPEPPNAPPVANAGLDKTITLPVSTSSLSGSGTDADGTVASYAWTQSSGPSVAGIATPAAAATNLSALQQGVYVFTLTVTDNKGSTGVDQVIVTVLPEPPNAPPVANAGTDITITLPVNNSTLVGSGTDSDGTISTYAWTQTSGPNTANIATPAAASSNITGLIEGNYVFTLTVTDNRGSASADQVVVKVLPVPPNQPPVANAGPDKNITLPTNSTQFVGSGTDSDGTISSYQWVQQSGPTTATIVSPAASTTNITNLAVGTYTFALTVTDNRGDKGSDLVVVNVFPAANIPPTANAGTDITITLPMSSTLLSGSGTDPDGSIVGYLWVQVSGPSTASFTSTTAMNPTVSALTDGIYNFALTVTDNNGAQNTDQVKVTVLPQPPNQLPVANAGLDQTLTLPTNSVVLLGSGTDADGTIVSYQWAFINGPGQGSTGALNQPSLTLTDLGEGIYTFQLVVTDNRGATAMDEVKVFVDAVNQAPVANAGIDKTITLPTNTVSLVGSGTDPDGTITSYVWEQTSGPNASTIDNEFSASISVSGLTAGIYVFTLRVTDNDGIIDTDQVTVTVNPAPPNVPPVAATGPDLEITLPTNSVVINGSGTDSDGTIASYAWSQVNGPNTAGSTATNQQNITFSNLIAGTYVFRLTVTDNQGANGQKDINVKVNPQPVNIPPVANAGADKQIVLPVDNVSLTGSGTDTDGTIASYAWTQINGPSIATLTAATSASTAAQDLVEGIYVLRLTVTDDKGVSAFDEVAITVKPIPYNIPPIANAGNNVILTLPTDNASLTGTGTDEDGSIAGYNWNQISGPSTATTSDVTQANLNISDLVVGVYVFRLTVTDDKGSTGFDEINIRVQPVPANQPPTADAGPNKNITLPDQAETFSGGGTDTDGTISTYAWTQTSGPTTATLSGQATATLSASALNEGTYIFRLTVTDNAGQQGFDEVNVRVNPTPPNAAPIASAGANISITLPVSSTPITGSGIDTDGTIATYAWTQSSGPSTATLAGAATANLTASAMIVGVYVFRLTVTDDDGATSFDEVSVTVNTALPNNPPTVDAGPDLFLVIPPPTGTLTGTATDADGTISSTAWTQVSGPNTATITNANALTASLSNLQTGTYNFRLSATDDGNVTAFDEVVVTVSNNLPPVAFAGGEVEVFLPNNTIDLNGGGTDPDGSVVQYLWEQTGGSAVSTSATDQATLSLNSLSVGVYTFRLTVTDNSGATDTDEVTVEVQSMVGNNPPTADAGEDSTVVAFATFELHGSGTDSDGTIASYFWNQVSGPSPAEFSDPSLQEPVVSEVTAGTYVFQLTVTDDGGSTATATVTITVTPLDIESAVFPKVFTPNGDDKGQTWTWADPSMFDGCLLSIYTRFGKKVFEMTSYDNSWDGTFEGQPLEEEAYYFIIKCGDGQQTTGGVRIVR